MKKRFLTFILTIATMLMCIFGFSACGGNVEFKINFVVENEVYATVSTSGNEVISMPENPTKDDYTFDGWYWDKDTWEKPFTANSLLDAPLSSDMKVYAKFNKNHTHEYTPITTEPTCTEKGIITYTCSCGDSYTEDIPATGEHTWDDGKVTTEPTCTEKGVKTFTCTVCETTTYTEDVEALTHDEKTHEAKAPTCTEIGWNEYVTCEREGCEYSTYKEIPATGVHTWDDGEETIAPTCTKEGETTYTCMVCKKATKTEPIDKLPHEHAEKWTSNATYHWHECECGDKKDEEKHTAGAPATATMPQTCTVCGYVLQVETGILFNTLTVDGTKVYGKVSNTTTEFSFIDEVTVKGNATYVVDNDKDCGSPIYSKTVDLVIGDNTFYVLEMIGNDVKLFTITIRRRPMYEVTFNANGGTSVEKQVIEEDFLATEPETTRTGYTFTGWNYDFATPITQTTKITASWDINVYNITYELNGGENHEDNVATYTIETATITLQTPTRTGYTFGGWFTEETFENQVTEIALGSYGEKTFYAKWIPTEYTITYHHNDFTAKEITSNSYTITNNSSSRWTENNGVLQSTNKSNSSSSVYKITANENIIVNFEYKVSSEKNFDKLIIAKNGNALETVSGSTSYVAYSVALNAGEYVTFTYSKDGSQNSGDDCAYIKNLTYAPNGEVEKVTTQNYNIETPTFGLITPTRAGYTFNGWFMEETFENQVTEIPVGSYGDKVFYAKWTTHTDTKYTVNYYLQNLDDSNYTLHETVELTGETDTTATAEIRKYTHFTFNNAYEMNVLSGNIDGDGNLVLSVYYTRDTYTISTAVNNQKAGMVTSSDVCKFDKEITLTATTNAGYTFLGWYDGETLACAMEEFTFKAEKDVTYTATWSTNVYNITYELNGGENHEENVATYTVETATITLQTPTRTGYTFNGWYTEEEFENQVTEISVGSYGEKKFYAKWIPTEYNVTYAVVNKQKEITFDYNYSGVDPTTVTLFLDEILAYPAEPSRSGYIFRGWFLDAACTQRFSFNEKIECDLTLYAGWQAHYTSGYSHTNINPVNYNSSSYSYSITASGTSSSNQRYVYLVAKESGTHKLYYKNSSSSSYYYTYIGATNVTAGKTIKSTSYCSSTSYNYISFTCSAGDVIRINIYRYNTSSYSNYGTAYFYFEGFEKTVSTACSNGIFEYETYNIETPTFDLITPTRAGYTFNGWFAEETFENQVTEIPVGSYGDKVFYAKWTAHTDTKYTVNYYLQNLENDNYTLYETVELAGTTDTTATAEIKGYEHFTYNENVSTISGNIDGNGNLVLNVYYTRNKYMVAATGGALTLSGAYQYGTEITSTATPYLGYEFSGWYSGETLLSNELTYTFIAIQDVTAQFVVKAEMSNFNFTSTVTTCQVTSIVDKTVTEIVVPNYVTSISKGAFSGCSNLTEITLPFIGGSDSATTASSSTLFGYIFGSSSYNGSSVIRQYYSNDYYGYTHYYIPNSLKSVVLTGDDILYGSFYNCSSLTSITIPDSVTSIGNYAFYNCSSLTNIYITDIAAWCNIVGLNNLMYYGASNKNLYLNKELITELVIPDSVTSISSYAFYRCSSLVEITIPFVGATKEGTSNTHFGYIFGASGYSYNDDYVPTSLKKVTITSATSIGNYAFYNCSSLTSVEIPDSVTSIGESAFYNCSSLTNVEIPDSVTSIGESAFYNCSSLTSVVIPDSVTSIGSEAFYGCSGLTNIIIPDSVITIDDYAFYGCGSLISVIIPDSVSVIGYCAFGGIWGSDILTIYCECVNQPDGWDSSWKNSTAIPVIWGCIDAGVTDEGFGWASTETEVVITNYFGLSSTLNIPESINGITVTQIAKSFVSGNQNITSVRIPSGIKSMGDYAFRGCNNLGAIYFDASEMDDLDSSDYIFSGAGSASQGINVTIGNNVKKIPAALFYPTNWTSEQATPKIISLIFQEGSICESIGAYAFRNRSELTSVEIPDSVTRIGSYAFSGCSGLASVVIGNSVMSIGDYAFYGCSGLTSIEIPDSITSIMVAAFQGCTSLQKITIPFVGASREATGYQSHFGYIFGYTDYNNSSNIPGDYYHYYDSDLYTYKYHVYHIPQTLNEVILGEGVTEIKSKAFNNCRTLIKVVISKNITSIGDYAFGGCTSLTGVCITDIAAWCNISFGTSSSNPLYYANRLYLNNELVTELVIPDSVTMVGDYAFSGYSSLTGVIIPNSVISIGDGAFYDCDGLTSVVIPDSVTSIGSEAFCSCSSLTSIVIGDSVTSIGSYAFSSCYTLIEIVNKSPHITVRKGSSSNGYIGYYALAVYNCSSGITESQLTNDNGYIIYTEGEEKVLVGYNGMEMNLVLPSYITTIYKYAFYGCSSLTSVEIPDSVTSIGESAFYNCSSLTSIEIPDGVTSIGDDVFYNCSSLTNVEIPDSVTSIGESAFYNCSSLTSVAIPDCVTSIGNYAFYNCSSLANMEIPDSVTSIGNYAFYNCSSLTSIEIPDGVTSIGDDVFYNCSSLTNVEIPDSVTSIGNYAFYNCSSLTSVAIPDCVTSIGNYAFYNCSSLMSVEIPDSVTSIGESAFYNCSSLTNVEIPDSVTIIKEETFKNCKSLTSLVLGNGVTEIEYGAFQSCQNLTSVNLGGALNIIGGQAFYDCGSLEIVVIGENVKEVGYYSFCHCRSLTNIFIGRNVTSISVCAFDDCQNLSNVYYEGTKSDWLKINVGDSGNTNLLEATLYFYSESEPILNADRTAYDGNYWHYIDGVATPWVYVKPEE